VDNDKVEESILRGVLFKKKKSRRGTRRRKGKGGGGPKSLRRSLILDSKGHAVKKKLEGGGMGNREKCRFPIHCPLFGGVTLCALSRKYERSTESQGTRTQLGTDELQLVGSTLSLGKVTSPKY